MRAGPACAGPALVVAAENSCCGRLKPRPDADERPVVIIASRTAKKKAHPPQGGVTKPGDLTVSPATSARPLKGANGDVPGGSHPRPGRTHRNARSSSQDAEENEGGFTLIELLVVIIIIGILAAIAIPVFLNQRKKGYDAAVKSDLRNTATYQETYLTDNNTYATTTQLQGAGFKNSANTTGFAATPLTSASYTNIEDSQSGKRFCFNSLTGNGVVEIASTVSTC